MSSASVSSRLRVVERFLSNILSYCSSLLTNSYSVLSDFSPQKLPPSSKSVSTFSDAYISITPFETGRMVTPAATLVEDARGHSMATSWRFFINHEKSQSKLWFDMGISHDLNSYIPAVKAVHQHFKPLPSNNSIEADTLTLAVSPAAVTHVIISHAHWDHIAPLPPAFTGATMVVGPGTQAACSPGYPTSPTSKFDARIFDPALRAFPLKELPFPPDEKTWAPLGPFENAHDFFGDGSLFLLNTPGHMAGHLAALARVRTKAGRLKWVLLGGDCAHCNIFTYWPEAPFGRMPEKLFPSGALHECVDEAREVLRRIAALKRELGDDLLVWYAHGEFLEGAWEL